MIFAISIISIIAIVAIPKLGNSLDKANIIKIRSDIILIQEALNQYKNRYILSANLEPLDSLEEDNNLLFSKILQYPIVSSAIPKSTSWIKVTNSQYTVWLNSTDSINFTYNSNDFTFKCDKNNNYCKQINQ